MTKPKARSYWLMKSEPDVFSIDDLKRLKTTPWEGVRSYQARNSMRDLMQVGDLALFYHSSAEPPGVAGLARVCSAPHADPTQFDPKSPYFDPKATEEAPRWVLVDVAFVEKFPELVTLATLKAEPALKDMLVVQRGQRLSIQPVTPLHFARVLALANSKHLTEVAA